MTTRETFYSPLNQCIKIICRETTSEWALRSRIRPVQGHAGLLAYMGSLEFIISPQGAEITGLFVGGDN